MTKLAKIPKVKSGDDQAVADRFVSLFNDAQNGLRRVIAFGLYAWQVKLGELRHGQFVPWIKTHVEPHGISRRSVARYMDLSKSVLEKCDIALKPFRAKSAKFGTFAHDGELLLLEDSKIPEPLKPLRAQIFSIIDGKSANALIFEFKQAEEDETGTAKPKRGRLKGQGGATREQRANAQAARDQAEIELLELRTEEFIDFINENVDHKHLGQINDALLVKLKDALLLGLDYVNPVIKSRKGGAK